jgi:hypothetical protein
MAEQFKNLASTTLSGDIDDSTTSISVASAMGFTGGDFRILVDSEIMKVTGVSGTTLTVARHQEGTSATAHTNGATVKHVLTAGALDAHDQNDLAAYDTYANRPAAGVPGRIFLPTDGLFIERDNGSIWEKFGPIWPMTPPQASDFPTWVNQGTSTIVDNKGAIFLQGQVNNGECLRCRVKAYPAGAFTVEMALLPNVFAYASTGIACGLCIRDSVGGKLACYGMKGGSADMNVGGYNYNSPTAASGTATGWPSAAHCSESPLLWIKYYDDGTTNRVVSISVDGVTWTQMASCSRTDFITPNQIGICVNGGDGYSSSAGQADAGMTVLSWRQY